VFLLAAIVQNLRKLAKLVEPAASVRDIQGGAG